jgi:hypothetical protein
MKAKFTRENPMKNKGFPNFIFTPTTHFETILLEKNKSPE